ncbi:helix-turn-helix domain-containing protein [Mucilaginibacter phyllosphaerae]|uniref:AraC family transcriptional regulator n=1 Tax=Mucilaginibacter phyllosphaerae TaxID=1812349 RepID=A0A4Y8AFE4_9SPHI|nr:helix-turn-helix domain-containing protein [Mucilaginibacter phyllosphaerae]MBB3968920.1 AraC-like DNA-binding protein [Mucilaginibacter phyllosphaerae]TEW67453.1 AraC family transcriptional regulator [Mucilaginibacter phyllosphaerae]GGH23527.1 AraC family transcriptional regulator [Mucilaginibacter phyllosphaerae]
MERVDRIDTVAQYNSYVGVDTKHPLVSVVNFSEVSSIHHFRQYIGVYAVFLKDVKCGNITYGCQPYDYEDGTLVFISPGQVYGIDSNGQAIKPSGYALVFHPDLIKGTHLGKIIKDYTFFTYGVHEALHLSKKERKTIVDCLEKIAAEIEQNIDKHSKTLIVSNIELFLNYCMRFYDRQFITRNNVNKDILTRFEELLNNYFVSGRAQADGLPSVAYCAEQLHLSANYFGDLIKKETGNTALEYIQSKLINEAKGKMFDTGKSINEISGELGFKYQQHFTRLFKQKTGITPNEYRNLN